MVRQRRRVGFTTENRTNSAHSLADVFPDARALL